MPEQYIQSVVLREITAGEATVVNGVQQVRLAPAVEPADTGDTFPEIEGSMFIILELGEDDPGQG